MSMSLSVVVPVFNEEEAIGEVIDSLHEQLEKEKVNYEIIVVDDGSTDSTNTILKSYKDKIGLITHPENIGYGRSIKDGVQKAKYPYVAIVDSDASYPINRLPDLMRHIGKYDMVVGARSGKHYWGAILKYPARLLFLWLSEFVSGRHIPDVNSGFRIFKKEIVMKYFSALCPGFSFTTTITLAMSLGGYFIKYVPIEYYKRKGKSKIRFIRDTLRSLQVITETTLYYNPIKAFILLFGFLWVIGFTSIIAYTLFRDFFFMILAIGSFLFSFIIFGLGLIADLIRKLNIKNKE